LRAGRTDPKNRATDPEGKAAMKQSQCPQYARHPARGGKALVGCLVAIGVVLLMLAIAAYLVAANWRGWAADMMNEASRLVLQEADLPADEKSEMLAHLSDFAEAFKQKRVSFEQFSQSLVMLSESPLIPVGMVMTVEEGYLKPSTLTDEEKEQGARALQRYARGLAESVYTIQTMEEVFAPIGYKDGESFRLNAKSAVNDDMLRLAIDNARAKADASNIPDEAFVMDLSDELRRILDPGRTTPGG
jgi:hypothetical protein